MKRLGVKGMGSGLFVIIVILFSFAFFTLIAKSMWINTEDVFENLDENVVSQETKDDIIELGGLLNLPDKLFSLIFVLLLIFYLISANTISPDKPVYIIFFFIVIMMISVFSMILSNGWAFLIEQPSLSEAASSLTRIDFFMKFLPFITIFIGLVGAAIFYNRGRNSTSFNPDNYGGDVFE